MRRIRLRLLCTRPPGRTKKVVRTTVADLAEAGAREGITKTALITVGGFLGTEYERVQAVRPDLYDRIS